MRIARGRRRAARGLAAAALAALVCAAPAPAQLPIESIGQVSQLPAWPEAHWVFLADPLNEKTALVDLDSGRFLGQVDGGWGVPVALFPRSRDEFYLPETHYSRGTRGERTDVLTIYDGPRLAPIAEVVVPPKRAHNPLPTGNAALSDDERFAALFNLTPATSLSVVDVVERRFAGEIQTPGCSLVYGAGPRRFASICADGSLLLVELDEVGALLRRSRSEPFFDPEADPVTEKAVRFGDVWLFVSFDGYLHPVDVSGAAPRFPDRWSLTSDAERADGWRIGGPQHLAVHERSGRLYVLFHQGEPDTHKDPGTELWVYDLARGERIQRIELKNVGFTFMGISMEFGQEWIWPFRGLYGFLVDRVVPALGASAVAVTQDESPLLVTAAQYSGSLALYDALSGEFLRRVVSGNMATQALQAPFGAEGAR